jgi:voltage-gated potassium channel Kch
MMLLKIAIAALLIVTTTAVHAGGMLLVLRAIRLHRANWRRRLQRTAIYQVGGTVLLMFLVSLVEVSIWAGTYLVLKAIQGFEHALYFSLVTFTTLGYGDVVLDEHWRLLASFEAVNGIILFGWTTAIVLAVVQRVYFTPKPEVPQGDK